MEYNTISLRELMKEYPVYFDACILFARKKSSKSIKEKESFYALFEDCIKDGANFYIPASIYEEIKYKCRTLKRLVDTLNRENKVLKIDWKDEECKRLGGRYLYLKEKYGMSFPDYNFLIMGMTKLNTETSVGLVSNDSGIFRAKDDILRGEHIWRRKVKFFARNKSFNFKRIETLDDLINFKFL